MANPITPAEVQAKAASGARIPEEVFEVVNDLIQDGWNGKTATVYQKDVVATLVDFHGFDRQEIFASHYLDFEPAYGARGWVVAYDKPMAYAGETYEAHWVFSPTA